MSFATVSFVGRGPQVDALRGACQSDVAAVWVLGVYGVGKRSLVQRALDTGAPDRRVARVRVRDVTGETELVRELMAALGRGDERPPWAGARARSRAGELVAGFVAGGGLWVFEDVQHWLYEDGTREPLLDAVLAAAGRSRRAGLAPVVLTSTIPPRLSMQEEAESFLARLGGLDVDAGVALLRACGAADAEALLRRVAGEARGHPLVLSVAGRQVSRFPLGRTKDRPIKSQGIIDRLGLDATVESLLATLAVIDGPLPAGELAAHLGLSKEGLAAAYRRAASCGLLWEDELGFAGVHRKWRENFMDAFWARPRGRRRLADLADRMRRSLHGTASGSRDHVRTLVSAAWLLALAGRIPEALDLLPRPNGVLEAAGIEHFRKHRFGDALSCFERIGYDDSQDLNGRLLLAQCLAEVGRVGEGRQLADALLGQRPDDPHVLRGRARVDFIAGAYPEAMRRFQEALVLQPHFAALHFDIGHCLVRMGDYAGARAALAEESRRRFR